MTGCRWITVIIMWATLLTTACAKHGQAVTTSSSEQVCTPVRIAVIQDNTGSINWTGTPTLTLADFEPLVQRLQCCGGEFGFGLITEKSSRGLLRLVIGPPPIKPEEPSKEGNPYKVAERWDSYKKTIAEFNKKNEEWREDSERKIARFKEDAGIILRNSTLAKRSDVWEAIRRVNLFLSEDISAWGQEPLAYAILITDGMDNVGKERVTSIPGKLILVNGNIGALEGLHPLRFESVGSAVRFVMADAGRK